MGRKEISDINNAELYEVRDKLLEIGVETEQIINDSIKSLVERDSALARQTIDFGRKFDDLVVGLEEKCHNMIATRQLSLQDLRFITMGMKIVIDLKRISKLCAGVAKRALELIQEPPLKTYIELPRMAHWAAVMVKEALAAFVRCDDELSLKVCKDSQLVFYQNEQVQRVLRTFMMEDPETISHGIKINHIAKCLEQIAGHATKIAEMAMGTYIHSPKSSLPPFAAEIRV